VIHVRSLHPRKTVHLPYAPGCWRELPPGMTTMLPERVLHRAPVRRLLARQLIAVVDGHDKDADARQARSARTEWPPLPAAGGPRSGADQTAAGPPACRAAQ